MAGKPTRGTEVTYGDWGLVASEPAWIKSNQIEAARVAMTRYIKRGGQVWISLLLLSLLRPVWVPEKVLRNTGLQL